MAKKIRTAEPQQKFTGSYKKKECNRKSLFLYYRESSVDNLYVLKSVLFTTILAIIYETKPREIDIFRNHKRLKIAFIESEWVGDFLRRFSMRALSLFALRSKVAKFGRSFLWF